MTTPPLIRPGRDADAEDFIAVVSSCWAEYPGCVIDVDGEAPELRALATHAAGRGGAVWAAEAEGRAVGLICTWPLADGAWELAKMYVAAPYRGGGTAGALAAAAEDHARAAGGRRMHLWTDTRFDRAHRFYEKRGYLRAGALRALNDRSHSIEFPYGKPLTGLEVAVLDAAAAASAEPALTEVLCACVDGGAAVSFLPPLPVARARAFWRRIASDVAVGRRLLVVAWLDGMLAGTVQLDLAMPDNQPHRADLQKLLVLPGARRRGVARALMQRAEQAARHASRTLVVLDTRADDAAEPLYRSLGWMEAGRIPDYAMNPDGTFHATVLFYKRM